LTKLQNVNSIEVDQKTVSNKDLCIEFTIILPEGCNITFVKYQLWLDVGSVLQLEDKEVIKTSTELTNKIVLMVPPVADIVSEIASIEVVITYNNASGIKNKRSLFVIITNLGLCKVDSLEFIIPLLIQTNPLENGINSITLQHEVRL